MFKWLGQVHVAFARHSNWFVKVASAIAVAFGGITCLSWGVHCSFCGYAVLRAHRLKYAYKYLIRPYTSRFPFWKLQK